MTKLLTRLPNTVHSCSRHVVVAVRLTTERPGSVVPFSKTFPPLGAHSQLQSPCTFLKQTQDAWWRMCSVAPFYHLPTSTPASNNLQIIWSLVLTRLLTTARPNTYHCYYYFCYLDPIQGYAVPLYCGSIRFVCLFLAPVGQGLLTHEVSR